MKQKVLSCIQPTGHLHFGNFFGAIQNWVKLQEEYDCIYGIVDYHAMTMPFKGKELFTQTNEMVIDLLACGIDPHKAKIIIQSMVPEHTELAWIFNCVCSYGELSRMTQFKDKSSDLKSQELTTAGLFTYPVLQAADILIYKPHVVPVGQDQKQHIELCRTIADRFNKSHGDIFPLPEIMLTNLPKLLSLADPSKKMSKSLGEKHYIGIYEDEATIREKVKSAVTTSCMNGVMAPGVNNLLQILKASGKQDDASTFENKYFNETIKFVDLKQEVANSLVTFSNQFREKRLEIEQDKTFIKDVLSDSALYCRKQAQETLSDVKELVGLRV
jgi:tryptophanyl-tRNA synthetase